jgi:molybdate transport system substrate-binding protein
MITFCIPYQHAHRMGKNCIGYISIIFLFGLAGCGVKKETDHMTLFAASSLTEVIRELSDGFEKEEGIEVRINLASSGALARQIEHGAGADLYISAHTGWVDYLDNKMLIRSWADVARNRLVLVTFSGSRFHMQDTVELTADLFGDGDKMALGSPEIVPAGQYARQTLQYYGIFEELMPWLMMSKDVRTALRYVELKEAMLGMVYLTDAMRSESIVTIGTFPETTHDPIVYRAAITGKKAVGETFMEYLQSTDARLIWRKHGFTVEQ